MFNKFVYLNIEAILSPLKKLVGESWGQEYTTSNNLFRRIANKYNELNDSDFVFSTEKDTVHFPSGFTSKEGNSIDLYCVKNSESAKSTWVCNKLFCNNNIEEGILHGIVNADWYDICFELKQLKPDCMDDVKEVVRKIEDRYVDTDPICLKDGVESEQTNADQLFVPTGYFIENNSELYLCCTYHYGSKGYGWYYDCITYKDAPLEVYDKKFWLKIWAGFNNSNWTGICKSVANQTLPEKWSFGNRQDYGILRNYLIYTFAHQWNENEIRHSIDNNFAVFNTGLPDRNTYKYIYALFEKIKNNDQTQKHFLHISPEYQLRSFAVSGRGGDGKIISDKFQSLPNPPKYFAARSSTVWELEFDSNNGVTIPEFDDTHILIQRCDRLPLEFFRNNAGFSERLKEILDSETDDAQKYKNIREFFAPILDHTANNEVSRIYNIIHTALTNVIQVATKKLSWNWRAVVPCYNPERDEPCFLLPVSFCDPSKPDRAMIASANEEMRTVKYTIHTVIPLEWAYLDARLVCRPESEWLAVDSIGSKFYAENS